MRRSAQADKKSMPDREPVDYSHEVELHRSLWVRLLLAGCGLVSLALGIIGIFLPLLPTTPFLLLAAICFANSSERFYNWLMNHRHFGEYIRNWRLHGTIPRRAKITAIILIVLTIGSSVLFVVPLLPVQILLVAIGLGVILYLWRMPTTEARPGNPDSGQAQ